MIVEFFVYREDVKNIPKNENIELWFFANILFLIAQKDSSRNIRCYKRVKFFTTVRKQLFQRETMQS